MYLPNGKAFSFRVIAICREVNLNREVDLDLRQNVKEGFSHFMRRSAHGTRIAWQLKALTKFRELKHSSIGLLKPRAILDRTPPPSLSRQREQPDARKTPRVILNTFVWRATVDDATSA